MEYPARLRISAPQIAATIAAEGPIRAEHQFRSSSAIMRVSVVSQRYAGNGRARLLMPSRYRSGAMAVLSNGYWPLASCPAQRPRRSPRRGHP